MKALTSLDGLLRISFCSERMLCRACDFVHHVTAFDTSGSLDYLCGGQTELDSFLIEISALILAKKDDDGSFLVDKIQDKTGMKGTGTALPQAEQCLRVVINIHLYTVWQILSNILHAGLIPALECFSSIIAVGRQMSLTQV